MLKFLVIFFILILNSTAFGSTKENIIKNLISTQNLNFNFEQNINGKIETGNCSIEYPKKIFCNYNLTNKKILVSNGKYLVIKTKNGGYYRYPIAKTPLNYILDKKFLIKQIKISKERIISDQFINFTFYKNENEINMFFDKDNYNLIGWQTLDVYQNLNVTYLRSVEVNKQVDKNLFKLPIQN